MQEKKRINFNENAIVTTVIICKLLREAEFRKLKDQIPSGVQLEVRQETESIEVSNAEAVAL